jgi:hypothetical protein
MIQREVRRINAIPKLITIQQIVMVCRDLYIVDNQEMGFERNKDADKDARECGGEAVQYSHGHRYCHGYHLAVPWSDSLSSRRGHNRQNER